MPRIQWSDIVSALQLVDREDVLELITSNQALQIALSMSRPVNWWGSGATPEHLLQFAGEDGIAITWLPKKEILAQLFRARNKNERYKILLCHKDIIVDEISALVKACNDSWIESESFLVTRSLIAFKEGHYEASMALSVSICEPLAIWASTPRLQFFDSEEEKRLWEETRSKTSKYRWASDEIASHDLSSGKGIIRQALIAPIKAFFKPFKIDGGSPYPLSLSRHAVAHKAKKSHFTEINSLLGIMLATSLLREQQSWCEEVRLADRDDSEVE